MLKSAATPCDLSINSIDALQQRAISVWAGETGHCGAAQRRTEVRRFDLSAMDALRGARIRASAAAMSLFESHDWHSMTAQHAGAEAGSLIKHAMLLQQGAIPQLSGKLLHEEEGFAMTRGAFNFVTRGGVAFHYSLGERLVVDRGKASNPEEAELFQWGTVLGVIAWINGLVPLHASCVTLNGRTFAFTGPSGAGKSTLAAGLAQHGAVHLSDDTLIIAPSSEGFVAVPDGKPLKLWQDSLSLTGLESSAPIKAVPGKHFARLEQEAASPAILSDLVFMERGREIALEAVTGGDKLMRLPTAFYRETIHIKRSDKAFHARMMLGFSKALRMWRLQRPRRAGDYEYELAEVLGKLQNSK